MTDADRWVLICCWCVCRADLNVPTLYHIRIDGCLLPW